MSGQMTFGRPKKKVAPSPLGTPKGDAATKKEIISLLGKDTDGAFRIRGRKDKGDRIGNQHDD